MIFGKTFPLDLGDIACKFDIHNLNDEQSIILKKGQKPMLVPKGTQVDGDDVLITFYKSYVHPQDGVMIYKITYKINLWFMQQIRNVIWVVIKSLSGLQKIVIC